MREENLIIVGAGPAGLTAAIYAARAGLSPVVFEKLQPGGMVANTDWVENYPGFEAGVNGMELAGKMHQQAERFGARFEFAEVHAVAPAPGRNVLQTDTGEIAARTLIAASGTGHRLLGIPGEHEYFGRGVSICGTCDGPLYRGKTAGVVGGGNSAVQEAMFVARFAKKVYLFHRRDKLRADKVLADRILATPNVEVVWDTVPVVIVGDEHGVHAVRVHNKKTGAESTYEVDGFFVFIGLIANTRWLGGAVKLNDEGFIEVDHELRTSAPGIFGAGDVVAKDFRQITTAVSDGARAARMAELYLDEIGSGPGR